MSKKVNECLEYQGDDDNDERFTRDPLKGDEFPSYEAILVELLDSVAGGERQACMIGLRLRFSGDGAHSYKQAARVIERLFGDCAKRYQESCDAAGQPAGPLSLYAYPHIIPVRDETCDLKPAYIYTTLWFGKFQPGSYIVSSIHRLFPNWLLDEMDITGSEEVLLEVARLPETLLAHAERGICSEEDILEFHWNEADGVSTSNRDHQSSSRHRH